MRFPRSPFITRKHDSINLDLTRQADTAHVVDFPQLYKKDAESKLDCLPALSRGGHSDSQHAQWCKCAETSKQVQGLETHPQLLSPKA